MMRHALTRIARTWMALLTLSGLSAIPLDSSTPVARASGLGPTLRLASAPGHTIAVRGAGWKPRSRIVFSVHYAAWTAGLVLRGGANGRFRVAADTIDLCGGVTFIAGDTRGHHAVVHGPPLMCASRAHPPQPTFTVLAGTQLKPRETRIIGLAGPREVTMRVGDIVYLQLSGAQAPQFTPSVDPRYLSLLSEEATPPRACPQVDCSAGFAWRWVALRPGDTGIALSPGCRKSVPPCEIPDFLIRVHIDR